VKVKLASSFLNYVGSSESNISKSSERSKSNASSSTSMFLFLLLGNFTAYYYFDVFLAFGDRSGSTRRRADVVFN